MKDKNQNKLTIILFITILFTIFIANILIKDKEISISERRKLNQFPQLNIQNILNGKFSTQFEKYTTDQFIFRDTLRKIKATIDLKIKKDYHNIYITNNYLVEQTYHLSESSVKNFTTKTNEIKTKYITNSNIYYSIIPDKNYYINDKNLKLDYQKLQNILNEELIDIKYIDIIPLLSLDNYYKTDSHWKQETLIPIANQILNSMNNSQTNNYIPKEITNFKGVYSYQIPITNAQDKIIILTNETIEISTTYNYINNTTNPIYNLDKINTYDKYDIYLNGADPLIRIDNPTITTNKELIIFRDSFASSLTPLLINSYKTIYLVDTRYISSKLITNYINLNNKDILFIYCTSTINNSFTMK